jgi:hypothetical protein
MAEYKVIKGDATRPEGEGEKRIVIPHVVNDIGKWGRGFVLAINKRWGTGVMTAYQQWFSGTKLEDIEEDLVSYPVPSSDRFASIICQDPFKLGSAQFVLVPDRVCIANMVGQHGCYNGSDGRPPIRYGALAKSMELVTHLCINNTEIHCPKFGSDLSGGHWPTIELMIKEIWVDAGIPVTVYEWEG